MKQILVTAILMLAVTSCSLMEDDIGIQKSDIIGTWKLTSTEVANKVTVYETIEYLQTFTDSLSIVYDNKGGYYSHPKEMAYSLDNGVITVGIQKYEVSLVNGGIVLTDLSTPGRVPKTFMPYNGVFPTDSDWTHIKQEL